MIQWEERRTEGSKQRRQWVSRDGLEKPLLGKASLSGCNSPNNWDKETFKPCTCLLDFLSSQSAMAPRVSVFLLARPTNLYSS